MRPDPTPPFETDPAYSEPEGDEEAVATDPARRMVAILVTIAVAVLIWPVLLHPSKPSGAKTVRAVTAQTSASAATSSTASSPHRDTTTGAWLPTESTWGEQLRSGEYWSRHAFNGSSSNQPRSGLSRADRISIPWPEMRRDSGWMDLQTDDRSGGKTYRTMCVRLCDGFYWPVSFSVTKDRFDADADTCARSCGGADQAKLFVYRNPGSQIDDMEDLDGHAYKKLKTAFLFKTKYEASCKCRPDPWDQASIDKHKSYALAQQVERGNKAAVAQLQELRTKIRNDEKATAISKSAQSKSAKSASLSPPRKGASVVDDAASGAPIAAATASVARTNVIRGFDKQSGNLRSVRKPPAAVVEADDEDEPAPAVRLRLGNRPAVDVRVRQSRTRKAAEATGSRVMKQ